MIQAQGFPAKVGLVKRRGLGIWERSRGC